MIYPELLLRIVPGGLEWVFIGIVVIGILFGAKKIPEIARSIGKASGEYEKAKLQSKKELEGLQRNDKDEVNLDSKKTI